MEGEGDPVAEPIDPLHPQTSEFLRYSLDLFNHGYFWESHVYFESLWNAHGRKGSIALFMQAMIKLGAAGVKLSIRQESSAVGHLERALELFNEVKRAEGETFLGFNLSGITSEIETAMKKELKLFEVHPSWEP